MLDGLAHAAKLKAGLHQHGEKVQLEHLHLDAALGAHTVASHHGGLMVAPEVADKVARHSVHFVSLLKLHGLLEIVGP